MSILEANGAVRFAKIDASSLGDNTLVAAVPGKQIRLLSLALMSPSGTVSAKLRSGTTDISGSINLAASFVFETHTAWGLVETAVGEALVLNLASGSTVGGWLSYQELK